MYINVGPHIINILNVTKKGAILSPDPGYELIKELQTSKPD